MQRLTRREMLRLGGEAGLLLGASKLLPGCTGLQPALPEPPDTPSDASARVAAVRGDDLAQMARDALAVFGGAAAIVQPGETVFIKPNFGAVCWLNYHAITKGDSVKPELVIAVAEECLKAGAARVTIGEGGQAASWNWAAVPTYDGTTTVAAEVARLADTYGDRIQLACLSAESPEWDAIESWSALSQIQVSSLAMRADRVISLPVIKTHRWTGISGSLKNLLGLTSVARYGSTGTYRTALHDAGLHRVVADIATAVRPDFAIMDFSIGCEGNGPHVVPGWWGSSVDVRDRLGSWMVLASPDPVALDATAARIIGQEPEVVEHLVRAYQQGVGQMNADKVELVGATLGELRMPWKAADLTEGFLEVIIPGIHLLMNL